MKKHIDQLIAESGIKFTSDSDTSAKIATRVFYSDVERLIKSVIHECVEIATFDGVLGIYDHFDLE